jgi:phosphonate transport system substrate-binding protein
MPHRPQSVVRTCLRVLVAAAIALSPVVANAANAPYRVSVVPHASVAEIHKAWIPFLGALAHETGTSLTLEVLPGVPQFEAAFLQGAPDFAFVSPYQAILAMQAQRYQPLVRDAKMLSGILVVKTDGPVHAVEDLAGKVIAFPTPNAFDASLYMRALLTSKFGLRFKPDYAKTESDAFLGVARGTVMAAGGLRLTLEQEPPAVRQGLRVLYETPKTAPHPLVAHPRVPERVRSAMTEAALRLFRTAEGRALLRGVQIGEPVRADYARDYLPLERLGLDRHVSVVPRDGRPPS